MIELLPLLNIVVIPVMIYVVKIERRLTRVETKLEMLYNRGGKKNVGKNTD